MSKYQIESVGILIADSNRQLRTSLKGVLHQQGFRKISDASDSEGFEKEIRSTNPDLILCDVGLSGGKVCETIHRLRHNKIGFNPFASVILFIDEPNEDVVRAAAEAGVDDVQMKPVVGQKIIDRVRFLIEKRKPFVVTTDYVGPDRRKKARPGPGAQEIPLVDVPNTIALKAKGQYNDNLVQREINNAVWDVNAQKIERHVYQVGYLVERIVPVYEKGQPDKDGLSMVVRLMSVARDIVKRLKDSDYGHIAVLAETLVTVTKSVMENSSQPKRKDLDLLPELASALVASVGSGDNADTTAREIQSSIQERYGK